MIRYLTLIEVLELHRRILEQSGGALGIRDMGLLESAIAQPRMTFGSEDLYPSLLEKATALGFSLIMIVGIMPLLIAQRGVAMSFFGVLKRELIDREE